MSYTVLDISEDKFYPYALNVRNTIVKGTIKAKNKKDAETKVKAIHDGYKRKEIKMSAGDKIRLGK